MNKRFSRANSVAHTSTTFNNIQQKGIVLEQEVDEIVNSTIIPFVSTKFMVVPRYKIKRTNSRDQLQIPHINSLNSVKLAVTVIYSKINKIIATNYRKKFMRKLKLNQFKHKLKEFLNNHHNKLINQAFHKIKKNKPQNKIRQMLILINYVNKKVINNQLSYAFRQVYISHAHNDRDESKQSLHKQFLGDISIVKERQNIQIRSDRSHSILKQNYNAKEDNQMLEYSHFSSSSNRTITTLKPDSIPKPSKNYSFWKVNVTTTSKKSLARQQI